MFEEEFPGLEGANTATALTRRVQAGGQSRGRARPAPPPALTSGGCSRACWTSPISSPRSSSGAFPPPSSFPGSLLPTKTKGGCQRAVWPRTAPSALLPPPARWPPQTPVLQQSHPKDGAGGTAVPRAEANGEVRITCPQPMVA